jgi:hypothetical protein
MKRLSSFHSLQGRTLKVLVGAVIGAIFFANAQVCFGQVKINEFVVEPNPEWIEFYNASASAEYLKTWWIDDDKDFSDDAGSSSKKLLSSLNTDDASFPYFEVSSFLNNGGDWVALFDADGSLIDSYEYQESPGDSLSIGRSPDESGEWYCLEEITKGRGNSNPVPSPQPTPSPSPSPTPAPSPSPSYLPSPQSSEIKPVSSPAKTRLAGEDEVASYSGEVMGASESSEASESSQSAKNKKPLILAIVLIVVGLGLVGGTGVVFYKEQRYNEKDAKTDKNT